MTDDPGYFGAPNPDVPAQGQVPSQAPGYPPPHGYVPQGYQPQGYPPPGYQPQAYPPPGYGYPPPGYQPYPQAQTTNGMAIASMVLGILWLDWIGSVLALIFGFVARSQIRQRNQKGDGMAIAGIVLGFVGLAAFIAFIIFAVAVTNDSNHFYVHFN